MVIGEDHKVAGGRTRGRRRRRPLLCAAIDGRRAGVSVGPRADWMASAVGEQPWAQAR